jgi:hypothetical protein
MVYAMYKKVIDWLLEAVLSFVHLRSRVSTVLQFALFLLLCFVIVITITAISFCIKMGNTFLMLRTEIEEMTIFSKPKA